jgi:superfamily II DNA or RNA helicase
MVYEAGLDVPTLNTLLMATPRPDIDQVVGRILRVEKSARKIHPLIIDIVDPQLRRTVSRTKCAI